jgi:RNA polymerase sigma-70 factor (ECF subfamily)
MPPNLSPTGGGTEAMFARPPWRLFKPRPDSGINRHAGESPRILIRSTPEAPLRAPKGFEQQALPHLDAAYSLAFWLMRDRADAEDVVQDAYVRALRGFAGFRGEAIRPWLLAIVRNVAWRALAVRRRTTNNVIPIEAAFSRAGEDEPEPMSIASDEPSAETRLIEAGDRALLTRALDAVSPLFREVLVLREIEDMSYADIAAVLGVPQGTVMSRLSRARAELRLRYKDLAEETGRHAV